MNITDIYKIYGTDYLAMTKRLLTASNLVEMLPAGGTIGIKPNLVSPTPAEYGGTTHPQVVAGIIEYLQEHGFTNIIIAEGSWVGDKTKDAYEYCGYRELCEKYDVEFVDAQRDSSHIEDCAGMPLKICDVVRRIDFMINVPVVKGHGQTKITCAMKNMKGLIPNTEKRHFHTMGLHKPIAHLSRGIHQDFIVADHICGDLELEDGGNPIVTNCIMTAKDPVLLDSYVCHMLGYTPRDVEYVSLAEKLGSGSTDLSRCRITVFEDSDEEMVRAGFPALDPDPYEERRHPSDNLLDISYAIEDADSCSACYASLAPAILRLKDEGLWDSIREKLPGRIAIGQGFAGKSGPIGVGHCCKNFTVNVPGCPPDEEDVYRMLKGMVTVSTKR